MRTVEICLTVGTVICVGICLTVPSFEIALCFSVLAIVMAGILLVLDFASDT